MGRMRKRSRRCWSRQPVVSASASASCATRTQRQAIAMRPKASSSALSTAATSPRANACLNRRKTTLARPEIPKGPSKGSQNGVQFLAPLRSRSPKSHPAAVRLCWVWALLRWPSNLRGCGVVVAAAEAKVLAIRARAAAPGAPAASLSRPAAIWPSPQQRTSTHRCWPCSDGERARSTSPASCLARWCLLSGFPSQVPTLKK
mmetsp:Transcript_16812/g.46343  ORF Transcript_16812/g.46343 Transcript_16812/m.46343 type:complete len:203 (+) Transcript_16812:3464-4072(+)